MRNGELMVGSGEGGFDSIIAVNPEDVSRNRNRNIIPRFFTKQVKMVDGGYMEQEYLELLIPGDNKSVPVHLVDDRLREQYSPHYKAFKENRELPSEGTPIEAWLGAEDGRIHMLRSLHLRTVEQIADMSDGNLTSIGLGGRELRNRAQQFLKVQGDASTADALEAKDATIQQLMKRLAKLENPGEADEEEDMRAPEGSRPVVPVTAKKDTKSGKGKR